MSLIWVKINQPAPFAAWDEDWEPVVKSMSEHFCKRWKERVGTATSVDSLNRMCRDGARIRDQKFLLEPLNGRLKPFVILAEYWLFKQNVIIKVDERDGTAVTLITPKSSIERFSGNREGRRWRYGRTASALEG